MAITGARKMEFDSLDGGEIDEHIGGGFVQIPEIFVAQDKISFGTKPFDRLFKFSCVAGY